VIGERVSPTSGPIMKITDIPTISSKDNARLKFARAVRDGREQSAIFVEGARLVTELLRSSLNPISIFISEDAQEKNGELVDDVARASGAEIHLVVSKVFESIVDTDTSQGIIVIADRPKVRDLRTEVAKFGLLVYLSKINNPSNLGAVLRTAEAAGASGVIMSPGSTDAYSPKSLRASMGSAFRLPIFASIGLEDAIDIVHRRGIRTIAADVNGRLSYTEADWRGGSMLILGSEAHGLEEVELKLVDQTIVIPMENGVESLNLAVSAGIIMFEAKRQRASHGVNEAERLS
jgi:RNA methyltransferase, TrmH family